MADILGQLWKSHGWTHFLWKYVSSVQLWDERGSFLLALHFFGMLHKLPFLFTFITAHKYFMNYGPLNCVALTH